MLGCVYLVQLFCHHTARTVLIALPVDWVLSRRSRVTDPDLRGAAQLKSLLTWCDCDQGPVHFQSCPNLGNK